ncbi:DUF5706 domain-containing protein [Puniceicoccaceae bacterium K14]|nr:DUF5706 domain-containing protein [Puniceicoccaceae bacterium K14]
MAIDPEVSEKFQQIAKGAILSSIESKHVQYISMADRRAQGILTISSILIPFSLAQINKPEYHDGVLVFLVAAIITIIAALLCLNPKRYKRKEKDRRQLLHFSGITEFDKETYLSRMGDLLSNTDKLAKEVASDLYHLSNDVLAPKFRYLRIAYCTFAIGIVSGTLLIINGFAHLF